ncbi:protein FAM151B [Thalassophryne amazonica]|uniref:protein FAM151B n=1 Tax=Thalassophryne amazonica TaxID=390379 RepID=UPI00147118BF|nr:protein FAM151B [Thalassophryne amazonica]
MFDQTLEYFLKAGDIKRKDAVEVRWAHAVNTRSRLKEALSGPTHMLEADVILNGVFPREPIMAHPPATDSDITLREWLQAVKVHNKGIKLDFKSLEAVALSVALLQEVLSELNFPIWVNADVLQGPGGTACPLDPRAFLVAVERLPPHAVLSLGWTALWTAGTDNPGYSWVMVKQMQELCREVKHPVTFPVCAALMARSFSQLKWLLQQSDRYTLTVWTGRSDELRLQDLVSYRKEFDVSRIYYDLPEHQRMELSVMSQN